MKISDHTIVQYKRDLFQKLIRLMVIALLLMGSIRIYEENYLQAISDITLMMIFIYILIKLKNVNEADFYVLARVAFVASFIALFILLVYTQERMTQFIWFSTAIYLMFFLFDKREGWRWFLGVVSILTILFFYDSALLGISGKDFLIWIFNIFAILLIISWYEKTKEESAQRLLKIQYLLSDKVKEKTLELQVLNENLEKKVESEVEKNREKDKHLLHQSRMAQMGEMLSMIAHQWRQPLAAISATSASLELKAGMNRLDNETTQQKARDISDFSQHLSKTIDDFRDFFKPDSKQAETYYDELMASVLQIIATSIKNKNIKLIQELNCHGRFMANPNEIKQVILNLIKNAEDALIEKSIKNPYIKISTYKENNKYILEVSDNAGGIPKNIIVNIFDPYFSTKLKKNGTGLGLYMSKTIIEEHCGGKLYVNNDSDGAVFTIEIPMKAVGL